MSTLKTPAEVFSSRDSFATTLLIVFVDLYGTEGFGWHPETIRQELTEDLHVRIPEAVFDRLMAAIQLTTSDAFYKSLPDFVTLCNVLTGDLFDPSTWDPADAAEITWAVTEAMLISPPDDDDEEPFIPEITAYIGKVLDSEGITDPPDVLRLATHRVNTGIDQYADDPEMYAMMFKHQADNTAEINSGLLTQVTQLAHQLGSLQLQHGNTKDVVVQALSGLATNLQTEITS